MFLKILHNNALYALQLKPNYSIYNKIKNQMFLYHFTGSISHHHGVGKLRKKWYTDTVSEPGRQLLFAAKKVLDPDNIFALGNIAFEEHSNSSMAAKSKL